MARIINGKTELYGILGNPLSHSFSPIMHNGVFEAMGMNSVYVPLNVSPDSIQKAVDSLRICNFKGANVTLPFKQAVIPHLDEISESSELIGAVNTILNNKGKLTGTTTDGLGCIKSFQENGHSFKGNTVAILGTGGAARSIIFSLILFEKPEKIFLLGRNTEKLSALAGECESKTNTKVEAMLYQEFQNISNSCNIIVQTTSVGMGEHVNESVLKETDILSSHIVYDIIYNPAQTKMMELASSKGAKVMNGLGMLVHQGLESFKLWTGKNPDSKIYFDSIHAAMN